MFNWFKNADLLEILIVVFIFLVPFLIVYSALNPDTSCPPGQQTTNGYVNGQHILLCTSGPTPVVPVITVGN